MFVLLYDQRPRNIFGHIKRASANHHVALSLFSLQGEEYAVLIAQLLPKHICILAPITQLGMRVISGECESLTSVSAPGAEEVFGNFSVSRNIVNELMESCFVR